MQNASVLKLVRQLHNYTGVFFAPTILFFAITGALQMFGLHESAKGSSYVPPALLVQLSQLHKKGTLIVPAKKFAPEQNKPDTTKSPTPQSTNEKQQAAAALAKPRQRSLPIKIFFAATALALVISTLTGLLMAWKYARKKMTVVFLLIAGVFVPGVLLFF